MRRALYRSGWLLILCVLVLALGAPVAGTEAAPADGPPMVTSGLTHNPRCTSALDGSNQLYESPLLFKEVTIFPRCNRAPATVLINRDRLARNHSAGVAIESAETRLRR